MDKEPTRHPRFYKSADRKFLGVGGGIADYFGWDPTLVRVAIVCGLFLPIPLVGIGYFALAFLAPHEYDVRDRRENREAWRAANRDYWRDWAEDNGMGGGGRGRRAAARARRFRRQASEASAQFSDALNQTFAPGSTGGENLRREDNGRTEYRSTSGEEAHFSTESAKKPNSGASKKLPLRVLVSRVKRRFADIDDRLQDLERAAVSGDVRLRKAFRDLEKDGPIEGA